MYEILVGGKTYKVQVDENGTPTKVCTYNEAYKTHIEISFSESDDEAVRGEVQNILKSLYISRILNTGKQPRAF